MTVDGAKVPLADDPSFTSQAEASFRSVGKALAQFAKASVRANELIAEGFSADLKQCSRCQWPHICGYRNPCNLAALGIPNEPVLDRNRHNTGWIKP